MSENPQRIVWHEGQVSRARREELLRQRGCVVWFTGIPGSGKSTVARGVEEWLVSRGHLAYVLDGDNVRHGLNSDLGFGPADRHENLRRIGEVAALFADSGVIVLTAFISPYRSDRELARELAGPERFVEVWLDVSLELCEKRDPKGLYRAAKAGEISDFTGISAPYEAPERPDVTLSGTMAIDECVGEVARHLEQRGLSRGPC